MARLYTTYRDIVETRLANYTGGGVVSCSGSDGSAVPHLAIGWRGVTPARSYPRLWFGGCSLALGIQRVLGTQEDITIPAGRVRQTCSWSDAYPLMRLSYHYYHSLATG